MQFVLYLDSANESITSLKQVQNIEKTNSNLFDVVHLLIIFQYICLTMLSLQKI